MLEVYFGVFSDAEYTHVIFCLQRRISNLVESRYEMIYRHKGIASSFSITLLAKNSNGM